MGWEFLVGLRYLRSRRRENEWMSPETCEKCGGRVLSEARACPHCGCRLFGPAAGAPEGVPDQSASESALRDYLWAGLGCLIVVIFFALLLSPFWYLLLFRPSLPIW